MTAETNSRQIPRPRCRSVPDPAILRVSGCYQADYLDLLFGILLELSAKKPINLVDKSDIRAKANMKRVLTIKTPIGGVVHIIPREDTTAAVGLTWKERNLTDVEKAACRQYLLEEGFMEHAVGTIELDAEIERFLKEIPDIA